MFVAASFENKEETNYLCSLIRKSGFIDYCFARDEKVFTDSKEMMKRAKEEIEKSDWLLIDVTEKQTGRAIEAGMAYSMGKKVVVIMKKGTQIKDTTRGISEAVIEYENIEEIVTPLSKFG
jgi:nucleoside 2-deoxyribosyltransferase